MRAYAYSDFPPCHWREQRERGTGRQPQLVQYRGVRDEDLL